METKPGSSSKPLILKKMYGPKRDGDIWRMRMNKEIVETYKEQYIVTLRKEAHVQWMEYSRRPR